MTTNTQFQDIGVPAIDQGQLAIDDGSGLRVVSAQFRDERKFEWDLFEGYDNLRVLTYSASVNAIIRMLDNYSFDTFECVFGCEGTLREIKSILAFQKVVVGDTRAAIMGLKDDRHVRILGKVHEGRAHFRVLRRSIAHAKLYLLSNSDGRKRVIVGSANLSEQAFSGRQPETLVVFDDDDKAWIHYKRMFDEIRDSASDEIQLPEDRIKSAEIEIPETPIMSSETGTIVIESPPAHEVEGSMPVQIERIDKVAAVFGPRISPAVPPIKNGKQRITEAVRKEISRVRLVKSAEDVDSRYLSIDRVNRTVTLTGKPFTLDWDPASLKRDASLLLDYFRNYEGAFEGNVARLQRDYFTLMAWLYFSPFICDLRSLALLQDTDVIRYPSFAILFGKSNCGKTSLVDTLMSSMFGWAPTVEKRSFTAAQLRGLQHTYRRFPVVFDDIGRRAFTTHGRDIIKDEMQPPVSEYPGFILSMNADPQSFPDEIVKRSLMIYTTTALPSHDEELRQRLQARVQEIRHGLTGHLYRCYLVKIMDRLEEERLPDDWLGLSSEVLSSVFADATDDSLPGWCDTVTWLSYAEKRYDRVKSRLLNLLRPSAYTKAEGDIPNGWTIEGSRVVVWEQRDAFGRRGFDWDDVPSTLVDEDASGGGRTVLHRESLEAFLGQTLGREKGWRRLLRIS